MSFQVSPGVSIREIDATNVIPAVSTSIGAYAGPFRWGPGGEAITVTSEKELAGRFGSPDGSDADLDRSFLTAASYLRYSGFLRVSRAIDDSARNASTQSLGTASALIPNKETFDSIANPPIGFHARYPGKIGDSLRVVIVTNTAELDERGTLGFDYIPDTTEYAAKEGVSRDEIHIRIVDWDGEITGTPGSTLEEFVGLSLLDGAQLTDGRSNYYLDVINTRSQFVYVSNLVNVGIDRTFTFDGSTFGVAGLGANVPAKVATPAQTIETSTSIIGGELVQGDEIIRSFNAEFVAGSRYGSNAAAGNNLKVELFANPDSSERGSVLLEVSANQSIEILTTEDTADFNGTELVFIPSNQLNVTEVSASEYSIEFIPGETTVAEIIAAIEEEIDGLTAFVVEGNEEDLFDFGFIEFDEFNSGERLFVTEGGAANVTVTSLNSPHYDQIRFFYDETFADSPETGVTLDKTDAPILKVTFGPQHTVDDVVTAIDDDSDFEAEATGGTISMPSALLAVVDDGALIPAVIVDSISFANQSRLEDGFVTVSLTLSNEATVEDIYAALSTTTLNGVLAVSVVDIAVNGTLVDNLGFDIEDIRKKNAQIVFGPLDFISLSLSGGGDFSDQYIHEFQFAGGQDGVTSNPAAIRNALDIFADPETIDISLVFAHKLYGPNAISVDNEIDSLTSSRRDCVGFISCPLEVADTPNKSTKKSLTEAYLGQFNSSYLVLDAGVRYVYNRYTDRFQWVPGSASVAGLCARTDSIADPWFSPAGFNRGVILDTVKLGYNPDQADRDDLYKKGINSIVTFPGLGTVLYGDKTAQAKPSAFDRINVRRLFIVIQKAISTAAKFQLFELNDEFTRAMFRNMVEPFLRTVQGRRGITDFLVVCDATNNTGEVIDANRFVGDIYIKPARSINFIQLNTIATRTGVEFSEMVVRN
jgi:hypothetical protein